MINKKPVILLFGPTASGKTGLSLRLAEAFSGAVINADSRQIYKGLPILTAMPSKAELNTCPHYLFEKLPLDEAYSVSRYALDVKNVLLELDQKNQLPIICGGTGFYLRVLEEGISPIPDVRSSIQQKWNDEAKEKGIEALYYELKQVDPELASQLKKGDTQRIIRGLSVYEESGQKLSDLQNLSPVGALDRPLIKIAILPDRQEMYARIHARFDKMMEMGLMEEVASLEQSGFNVENLALQSIGVSELLKAHRQEISFEEAKDEMLKKTRRYAKRQCTWLRGQFSADILVEDVTDEEEIKNIVQYVKERIESINHEQEN